jgi:hypothetical protein
MPHNPFDDDGPSNGGGGTNPFESSGGGSSNPFEGGSPPSGGGGGGTNPFGDDSRSSSNNPFENEDSGSNQGGGGAYLNQFGSRAAGFVGNVGNALQRPKVLGRVMRSKTSSDGIDHSDLDVLSDLPESSHGGPPASVSSHGRSVSISAAASRRAQSSVDAVGGWIKNRGGPGGGGSSNPFDDNDTGGGTNPFGSTPVPASSGQANSRSDLPSNDSNNINTQSTFRPNSGNNNQTSGAASVKRKTRKQARKEKQHQQSIMNNINSHQAGPKKGLGLRRGKQGPAKWPFDDFNDNTGTQYQAMNNTSNGDGGDGAGGEGAGGMDDIDPLMMNMGNQTINTAAAELGEDMQKEFERPADLPTITEAVRDLSLVDFERKAEERAISILSMWLHDSGLIDDLLVTGTQGYNSLAKRTRAAAGIADDMTVSTTRTSEGMEVGAVTGLPLETLKMDKEIVWLRNRVQRELTLVNSRLNDGVAASGAEVQELVNSVAATKGDLGRMRQMLTYITQSGTKQRDEFLLQNCPRLRQVMNARRNLFRCFRELDFFDQMPTTCERLREELHAGEWTTDEWNTIRNVSMEHVELEILLVEAEAGMKDLMDQNENEGDGRGGRLQPSSKNRPSINTELVDRFLNPHVTNVWELGEEIKMRITAGLNTAYDLASNNPAAMVALVEAVEVYERATEHYHSLQQQDCGDGKQPKKRAGKLKFTNMRASALATLCQHFTLRCAEVFRRVQMRVRCRFTNLVDPLLRFRCKVSHALFFHFLCHTRRLIWQLKRMLGIKNLRQFFKLLRSLCRS